MLCLLLVLAAWTGYFMGGGHSRDIFSRLKSDYAKGSTLSDTEVSELRRQLVMTEQMAAMDREALKAIKEHVKDLQSERLSMEEELIFLRGIVSADVKEDGLRIQRFTVRPANDAGRFAYRFTISQAIANGAMATGSIYLQIEGIQQDKHTIMALESLNQDKQASIDMRFKYYQDITGEFIIPDDFSPEKVTIEVKPTSKKLAPVKETFDWSPVTD